MNFETIEVRHNNSTHMPNTNLILSVQHSFGNESDIVIGYPGQQNEKHRAFTGDTFLYETPNRTYDIRVLTQDNFKVKFLVTEISPKLSILGTLVPRDIDNAAFTADELSQIALSIAQTKSALKLDTSVLPAQLALISKKLDDIQSASVRLGRKDWINYVNGTLFSMFAAAAFPADLTNNILKTLDSQFNWLFNGAILLLN